MSSDGNNGVINNAVTNGVTFFRNESSGVTTLAFW